MLPLRGYDSLSLGDLLQGITPASLSPPNMPGAWSGAGPDSASMMPAQYSSMAPRQSGLTRESLAALKAAMARIAPHVPPDMLQQHYIRRIAELSNSTPATLYPVLSYGSPDAGDNAPSGIRPGPLSPSPVPAAMGNPYVGAIMDRFPPSGADRQVQSVRRDDAPIPIDDLTSGLQPAALSPPNMPRVMESPYVRAAMARLATSSDANRRVQPVRVADPRLTIAPPSLSAPNIASTNAGALGEDNSTDDNAKASSSTVWDYLDAGARWAPVIGPVLDLRDDYKEGNLWKGALDAGFLASDLAGGWLLKAPAKAALKGLVKGGWKEELKPYWKMGSHTWAATRKEFGKVNELAKGMPVHHWLIPQRWQRDLPWLFPESLTNQPWNLLPMTRASEAGTTPRLLHDAIEGKGKQNFQFDPNNALRDYYLRFKYGTPDWAKVGIPASLMSAGGNAAEAGNAIYDYLYGSKSSKQ